MQNVASLWSNLTAGRRIAVIASTLIVFVAVLMLGRSAAQTDLTLLYAGLESNSAGQVVAALEQQGVAYEVRGDSIFVDRAQRDTLRMTLASDGLPANSSQGYELLDSLSGFGTTSQMFDAAYWRAKEGELARTIAASSLVQSARVHISNPSQRPFDRSTQATASVTVTTNGGTLTVPQAKAVRYLVASAVSSLSPDDVAVIDTEGGLIAGTEDPVALAQDGDRAASVRDRVERLLEARVGYGNAVVEVSLDTVTETEQITERTVDPGSRVAISTDTEEQTSSSQNSGSGNVTVASNLPDGEANGQERSSNSNDSETRERVNFDISEVQREVLRVPGAVKRLTVAVLVNGVPQTDASGNSIVAPRPAEELAALEELVASAVGFDEARGDVITIKSMSFDPVVPMGTEAMTPSGLPLNLDVMQLIQIGILALVALILGLFVVRPVLSNASMPAELPAPTPPRRSPASATPALEGEIDTSGASLGDMPVVSGKPKEVEDPVDRLRSLIGERQDDTVEVLRNWIDAPRPSERA
ncbi:flagellar basal-body MS-ring/collar protein FliF [Aestuariibius insulae]|uniref:flagellar basal-body MS-ring/collar protein FliF n=1 Tax=Aestuariibius insulae TaxID=2058287 RepID=UPI00345ECF60